jgi:hypothetical protein
MSQPKPGDLFSFSFLDEEGDLPHGAVVESILSNREEASPRRSAEWRPTLAGCKAIIHQHPDTTLTLMIAGHRVGHYSAEGKLLTPLTKKQIKAVEKTLKGKVQKQTFPFNLQIPQNARDSHFPTASTATNL